MCMAQIRRMRQLTASDVQAFVTQHELCLLAFVSARSAPAQQFERTLLERDDDDVAVGVIDVDREPVVASDFRVTALPTVAILARRSLVYLEPGALTTDTLEAVITAARGLLEGQEAGEGEPNARRARTPAKKGPTT